ncbi:hypothetical protein [Tropicimonas sp. IMCC34043]|uniref:hypothetical protein n=1 Tax=Tropicimonas sp. IMCC34043 TaxID=2248760 RepID=UPI000E239F0F|nr:hypothetical protein [Tropicimonas sp. IMCC34043]
MRIIGLALALACLAPHAIAQPLDSKAARKMLFGTRGVDVQISDVGFIDAGMVKALEQAAGQIPYYGAIAVSPGEPTSSNLMSVIGNLHSPESAAKAVLDNCNARRTTGGPCVVIAVVTPRKYSPQPLTLSVGATGAFEKEYRKMKAPKAMAISRSTGGYAMDRGDGGRAVSQCEAAAAAMGGKDCEVVIAD